MKISFTKMSGAGNDFVVVDNRDGIITDPTLFSIKVCDRKFGIGADGVLLLENSKIADFQMKYYNADGSNAGMCGNGGRCLSKFAFDNKVVSKNSFNFEGFAHIYEATRLTDEMFRLKMKNPFDLNLDQEIEISENVVKSNYINTGTDHSVVFLSENNFLNELNNGIVQKVGKEIRCHKVYQPKGTNVNFVKVIDLNTIEIRTYERGVEDETLACGTGSVASALISSLKYGLQSPVNVKVRSNEVLIVSFFKDGNTFSDVFLEGSAVNTFFGNVEI